MRLRDSDPPRWLIAVLTGVPFGMLMGLSTRLDGDGWGTAAFMTTCGVPFGLVMAWQRGNWRNRRERRNADIAPDVLAAARSAVTAGQTPDDPAVRAAAARLAAQDISERRQHLTALVVLTLTTIVAGITQYWRAVFPALCLPWIAFEYWRISPRKRS